MNCRKCGSEVVENGKFCVNCGSNLDELEVVDNSEIIFNVKPEFKITYFLCDQFPSVFAYSFIVLIFFLLGLLVSLGVGLLVLLAAFALAIIILLIVKEIKLKEYSCMNYGFYKTKLVIKDNFINVSEREIKYKDIKEVVMSQTFIQRYFKLGKITIYTNSEGTSYGIQLINIYDVEEVYKKVKEIINV